MFFSGIVDSSGIRFFYTDEPPQQRAAILTLGHQIVGHMIVPPQVERYTVNGYCNQRCTDTVSGCECTYLCNSSWLPMYVCMQVLVQLYNYAFVKREFFDMLRAIYVVLKPHEYLMLPTFLSKFLHNY